MPVCVPQALLSMKILHAWNTQSLGVIKVRVPCFLVQKDKQLIKKKKERENTHKHWLQTNKSVHSFRKESICRDKKTSEFSLVLASFGQSHWFPDSYSVCTWMSCQVLPTESHSDSNTWGGWIPTEQKRRRKTEWIFQLYEFISALLVI